MGYSIGVISDTHGLVRAEALAALGGCRLILHAGDVGRLAVLDALRRIAPVAAVRGNVDRGGWALGLPERDTLWLDGVGIHLLHDLRGLDFDPRKAGVRAVVFGHSHRPCLEWKDGVLYFNPGSAGPRRFRLPVAVGRLNLAGGALAGELVELAPARAGP
ncbi:metallophosphoesterase family protein [Candidatus Methylocalor cossyra]